MSERIRSQPLPCRVECVDFLDFRPGGRFDGAVFMGSLEHLPDYRHMGRFLAEHLQPRAGMGCDFVTSQEGRLSGAFMAKYIFPGVSNYVDVLGSIVSRSGVFVRSRDL